MPAMLSDTRLLELLAQDAPHGDLTTAALGIGACPGVIRYAARDAMTLACAFAPSIEALIVSVES